MTAVVVDCTETHVYDIHCRTLLHTERQPANVNATRGDIGADEKFYVASLKHSDRHQLTQ